MSRTAEIWRMETKDHICPFGLKSKSLLERKGFQVIDHLLKSRVETDHFKEEHHVKTTPQTFVEGQRIGGYDDVRTFLGLKPEHQKGTTYKPVVAIFSVALAMALAMAWSSPGAFSATAALYQFIAFSMIVLAVQKLRDLTGFSDQFVTYDLLAKRWVPYAYVYPFAEAYAGLGMLAKLPAFLVAPVGLFIGLVGGVSVIKAVYIDKRELKCACVGGGSKVPLGFVSLTENLFMLGAAIWMLWQGR